MSGAVGAEGQWMCPSHNDALELADEMVYQRRLTLGTRPDEADHAG